MIERPVTIERNREERLMEAHRHARIAWDLDEYLNAGPETSLSWEGYTAAHPEHDFSALPPERAEHMRTVVEEIDGRNQDMVHMFARIDQVRGGSTPAEYLFISQTSRLPEGEIDLSVQSGALVIVCEKEKDYLALYNKGNGSGGTMHAQMELNMEFVVPEGIVRYVPPVLLINGPVHNRRVLVHERQHWMNHMITETEKGKWDSRDHDERVSYPLRDEMLAFFRDGTGIEDFSVLSLYDNVFARFPVELREKYRQIPRDFKHAIDATPRPILDRARGLIVYHLLFVPVESMVRAYKHVVDFYKKHPELYEDIDPMKEPYLAPPPLPQQFGGPMLVA